MKQYDVAYKNEVCKRLARSDTSVAKLSRETGITENTLYKWNKRYKENTETPFVGSGRILPENEELVMLKREIKELREENDFLKKAAAYFAKEK
jgi:transposase